MGEVCTGRRGSDTFPFLQLPGPCPYMAGDTQAVGRVILGACVASYRGCWSLPGRLIGSG